MTRTQRTRLIVTGVICMGLLVGLAFAAGAYFPLYCLGGIGTLALFWVLASVKIVGPTEIAVKVILGVPKSVCFSGFRFLPWFFGTRLVRYPTKMYNLVFPSREIVSRAGEYGEPPISYGAQSLKIDSVVYLKFPRDDRLLEVFRSAIPTDESGLQNWTEEAVVGALRIALGQMTWREATENIQEVIRRVNKVFIRHDGTLVQAGFDPAVIQLTIKEIRLPKELESAFVEVDHARLRAEAAQSKARERAMETVGMVVESLAQSRGRTTEQVKKEIQSSVALRREFLDMAKDLLARQMAIEGKSFVDIRVGGAEGIEAFLLNLFAAWQRIPTGGGKKEKTEKEEISPEEKRKQKERDKKALEAIQ